MLNVKVQKRQRGKKRFEDEQFLLVLDSQQMTYLGYVRIYLYVYMYIYIVYINSSIGIYICIRKNLLTNILSIRD